MKEFTVFYAWQTDTSSNANKYFIKQALEDAIARIENDIAIEDSPRLDHDTKGVAGIPEIASTILQKIDVCGIFVADVTFVGQTAATPPKLLPNPNVMFELGYALKTVGSEAIICIMNEFYGSPSSQIFDLAHRRWPITYSNPSDIEDKKKIQERLSKNIEGALRTIITQGIPDRRDPTLVRNEMIREQFRYAIFAFLAIFRVSLYCDNKLSELDRDLIQTFALDKPMINGGGVNFKMVDKKIIKRLIEKYDLTQTTIATFEENKVFSVGELIVAASEKLMKECERIIQIYGSTGDPHMIRAVQNLSNQASNVSHYNNLRFLEHTEYFIDTVGGLFEIIAASAHLFMEA